MKELKKAVRWILNEVFKYDMIKIKYKKSGKLMVKCPKTFEDRGIKTLELFMEAFENVKTQIDRSFVAYIDVEDYPKHSFPMLSYSNDGTNGDIVLIPDFLFVNWKETGTLDYDKFCDLMVKESLKEPEYKTLFWIGNAKTHITREVLCKIAQGDARIEAYAMQWIKDENAEKKPSKYVSLLDHTKYKYLIDIQGVGWSARTKMLLFSGRPLFLVDRKWKEYWYEDIKPFVHYIPVREDLSDLCEKLDWAENNYDEAKKIAKNAQEFALTNLRRSNAVEYFGKVILYYSDKYGH